MPYIIENNVVTVVPDKQPYYFAEGEWLWRSSDFVPGDDVNLLSPDLFEHLPGAQAFVAVYPSREAAEEALSEACLAFARR